MDNLLIKFNFIIINLNLNLEKNTKIKSMN